MRGLSATRAFAQEALRAAPQKRYASAGMPPRTISRETRRPGLRILVLQHLSVEHPGSLRDLWRERGWEWIPVELDAGEPIPPLEGFDVMVAMGGPMDVWEEDLHPWLVAEKQAIRRWVTELKRPYLGVCLGHQLLADALGGKVGLMGSPEVGLTSVDFTDAGRSDPLFAGFERSLDVFQWHGAEVAVLPEGGVALASSPLCAVQAMRWGPHAYGVQFHAEIIAETVSDWERIPEYMASLKRALGDEAAAGLANEVSPRLPAFRDVARQLEGNFAGLIGEAVAG
jgi:GMP synthase-like glutamine amidotransferase